MNLTRIPTMALSPQPGEIMLYLDLHRVENMTPVAALKLAESLGFQPELRTRTWQVDGVTQTGLYALLHYEQREYNAVLEADYPVDAQFEALTEAITPDTAVHFTYNLQQPRAVVAPTS